MSTTTSKTKKSRAPKKTNERVVTADDGRKYTIAPRVEAGLVPCIGEAHDPRVGGMIDHCGLCAPEWGKMKSFEPVDIDDATSKGFAVPVGWDPWPSTYGEDRAGEKLRLAGKVKMVQVTEKTRACTSSFYVWVRA